MTRSITVFLGHYGSGKTSLAVNYALSLRKQGRIVTVADLDIVNPYFRTADSRALLQKQGIALISSPYANSNLDVPALPKELYAALAQQEGETILDVGGDDRGAVALGRFADMIRSAGHYRAAFTVNFYRPLTQTPEEALSVLREVELSGGLACTALVNNSNLGADTTPETLLITSERMERLSALSNLPVWMNAAREDVCRVLAGRMQNLFPVTLTDYATALSDKNNVT